MQTILVTGGCGFIGSNYIRHLFATQPDVTVVNCDKLTYAGNPENLREFENSPAYHFFRGDIADKAAVGRLFAAHQFDAVVHFAAESHVDRSITGPELFVLTNVLGTQNLLEGARQAWEGHFEKHCFVHVSTDEVYGSLGAQGYFTEETPLAPNSPYSASKAGSDLLVRSYVHTFGFPGIITRCSNNYGPYQYPEKLIPLMIANAIDNTPLPVYGDGMNVRDWLYVEDHCRAIEAVRKGGKTGEVYNIGGHNEWPNIEIVKKVLALLGKSEDLVTFVTDRPGHDRRYAIDASRLRDELGWEAAISFEEGISKTVSWYLENERWWRALQQREP